MDLKKLQAAYVLQAQACGIEAGDTVKVVRLQPIKEAIRLGFGGASVYSKNEMIGNTYKVDYIIDENYTFVVNDRFLTWHCLELLEKKDTITIGEHTVKFTDSGIKIGCQEISKETVGKIYRRLNDDK